MTDKKYIWHRLLEVENIPVMENELREVKAGSKKICVTRWQGKLYAFTHRCPHAGGFLVQGHIDTNGNIVCPVHRYKYNVTNGFNSSGEGYYLSTYPVEEREDGIYAGFVQSSGWLGLFKK